MSPGFIYSETEAYKRHITYESAKLNVCPMSLAQQVTRSSLFSAEYVQNYRHLHQSQTICCIVVLKVLNNIFRAK